MKKILFAILVLGLLAVFLLKPAENEQSRTSLGKLETVDKGIVDSGNEQAAYFLVKSSSELPSWANLTWRILEKPIPDQIFILEGPRIEAARYTEFKAALSENLKDGQRALNLVTLQELNQVPAGALLIVPTGALPRGLLTGKLREFFVKNQTILFIGMPFDVTLDEEGTPEKNKTIWLNESKKLGFEFVEANSIKPKKHFLKSSSYGIQLNGNNNASQIHIEDDAVLGINYQNQGSLVLVPNTLDNGWQNGVQAAADITQIIEKGEWQPSLATQHAEYALKPGLNSFFSPKFTSRNAYADLQITQENQTFRFSEYLIAQSGRVKGPVEVSPGQNVSLSAELSESFGQARTINLLLEVQIDGQKTGQREIGPISVKTIGYASTSIQANTTPGNFLLILKDDQGHTYAEALLHVKNATVEFLREDYGAGAFSLKLLKDGQPQANIALQITVDEGQNKTVITDGEGVATFNTHISVKPTHMIRILGEDEYLELTRPHVDPSIFNSPIVWAGLLLIVGIFGFGYFFAVQTRPKIWIDIPDLPQEETKTAPIKAENVIRAFENANKKYGRQHAPLHLDEIKEALKDELQLPARTTLTDHNVTQLLTALEQGKVVTTAHGLYLLQDWVKKSRKTAENLALKRLAIDELIKAGLPFQETTKADLAIQNVQIHLQGKDCLPRLQKSLGKNKNVLVLATENDVNRFLTDLRHGADSISVMLYLEFQHGSFQIVPVEMLAQEIKK